MARCILLYIRRSHLTQHSIKLVIWFKYIKVYETVREGFSHGGLSSYTLSHILLYGFALYAQFKLHSTRHLYAKSRTTIRFCRDLPKTKAIFFRVIDTQGTYEHLHYTILFISACLSMIACALVEPTSADCLLCIYSRKTLSLLKTIIYISVFNVARL